MKLTFAGAAGTVTGSRYLLESHGRRWLVDCGLFQGYKQLRLRNWRPFEPAPASIDAVVLTHAHLDHSGYLPALVRDGFAGPIHASEATCALLEIMLRDSAHLQESEAELANRLGTAKHQPALPLYTMADAERALRALRPVAFGQRIALADGMQARLTPAGHLLGAACVSVEYRDQVLAFSGDLGRPADPIMRAPEPLARADTLLVESTYGNRRHVADAPDEVVAGIVRETAARGGTVLVPSFAVGRAQTLMLCLARLKQRNAIPDLPVFLDSPMATDATDVYVRFADQHRLSDEEVKAMTHVARIVGSAEESKALAGLRMPSVIIAASGMATGGRVLHHLKRLAPDSRNAIVFVGYQAGGTRGAQIVAGAPAVKIHGEWVPVRASVRQIDGWSAHADADEILAWLKAIGRPPRQVYVVHGEAEAADALRMRIEDELHWRARVPEHMETVDLGD